MNHNKIKSFFQENGAYWIEWHQNPPAVSHMGGALERQIQTARNIWEGLLPSHSLFLNDESLKILLTGVELILNSRPLTVETLRDANSPTSISPSNLLTLKSSVVMSPFGEFSPQICIPKNDGDVFNTLLNKFGTGGKKCFCRDTDSTVKRRLSGKPVANGKNCQYRNWWKERCVYCYS